MKIIEYRYVSDDEIGQFNNLNECKNSAIEWIEFFKQEKNYQENNYNEDIEKIKNIDNIEQLNNIVFDYQFYYKEV